MAIRPHRVVDDGRVVLFEDGPLSYRDLGDTIVHAEFTHRRLGRRVEFAIINAAQAREVQMAEEVRLPYRDPLYQDYPGEITRIMGCSVLVEGAQWPERARRYMEGRRWPDRFIPTPENAPPVRNAYTTGGYITATTTAAGTFDVDAFKTKLLFDPEWFGGKKIDGVWLDEAKPKVETTHENW